LRRSLGALAWACCVTLLVGGCGEKSTERRPTGAPAGAMPHSPPRHRDARSRSPVARPVARSAGQRAAIAAATAACRGRVGALRARFLTAAMRRRRAGQRDALPDALLHQAEHPTAAARGRVGRARLVALLYAVGRPRALRQIAFDACFFALAANGARP
jgi:hypothetical protein